MFLDAKKYSLGNVFSKKEGIERREIGLKEKEKESENVSK